MPLKLARQISVTFASFAVEFPHDLQLVFGTNDQAARRGNVFNALQGC
jgi:hypothetical protein